VDLSCNEHAQTHEGMGAPLGWIGAVWGGWGGRPVREQDLFGGQFEALVRWNNSRDRGYVVRQVEGDGRQSDDIVDARDGRLWQGGDGIVPVPQIPGLVCSATPIKIEEEIRLGGNLSTYYQKGKVG